MKVLNVASLAPIPSPKIPNSKKPFLLFRRFNEGLSSLSSSLFLSTLSAKSLTYDEALGFSNPSTDSNLDFSRIVDGIVKFGSENPLIVAGGFAAVLVPVFVSQTFGRSKAWGVESAKSAYKKLGDDDGAFLIDIREGKEVKEVGSPDLSGLKKKVVTIAYRGEDKPGFLKKVDLKFRDPGNTTLFVIDK